MSAKKSIVMGAMIGFLIATITVLCAVLNKGNEIVGGAINFIASVPTFLFSIRLDLPQAFQKILFFVYWIVTGGLFGMLLSRKKSFIKTICVIIALVSLVIAHRAVWISLEAELRDALRSLEPLFTGKAYLEGVGK